MVGIVASRIIETYYKPTIVLCGQGDIITGSARSVKGNLDMIQQDSYQVPTHNQTINQNNHYPIGVWISCPSTFRSRTMKQIKSLPIVTNKT